MSPFHLFQSCSAYYSDRLLAEWTNGSGAFCRIESGDMAEEYLRNSYGSRCEYASEHQQNIGLFTRDDTQIEFAFTRWNENEA